MDHNKIPSAKPASQSQDNILELPNTKRFSLLSLALLVGSAWARPRKQTANCTYEQETRSLDEIH